MSGAGELKRDPHSDPAPQNKDRSDRWFNRKTFAEEAREITEEMKLEVARVVRETMKSPN